MAGQTPPALSYPHTAGRCAIIGGYVYRGPSNAVGSGTYIYGDYCSGWVRAARAPGGRIAEERDLGLQVPGLSSFGADADGELYALSLNGDVYRIAPA